MKKYIYKSNRAFTLIEVLVATAMFATIISALYALFHSALKTRENAFRVFETDLSRHYVTILIKRDIVNTVLPTGVLAGGFIGEKEESGLVRMDKLEFFTSSGIVVEDDKWGDIEKIEYYLEESTESPGKMDFVRAVTRNLLPSIEEEPVGEHLFKNVESLKILYYDGESWQDTWDSTTQNNELPKAVDMLIEFPSSENNEIYPVRLVIPLVPETSLSDSGTTVERD